MPYFRVDDRLHSHSKAIRAGTEALGLWVLAASWSMSQGSDGWVPTYMLARIAGGDPRDLPDRLVQARLWHADERDGDPGYVFHEWDEWQHSAAYLAERNRKAANRMRQKRANEKAVLDAAGDVRANVAETSQANNPTQPNTDTSRTRSANVSDDDPDWSAFWTAYPRKVAKGAARKAWATAVKAEQPATIVRAAEAFALACRGREQQFVPHPATWLRAEQWADQLLPTDGRVASVSPLRAWTPPPPPPEYDDDPAGAARWQRAQREQHLAAQGATA